MDDGTTSHALRAELEQLTGSLFEDLWAPYDEPLFEQSVELFERRLALAGFERDWIAGKRVLDAGCGGGRNSIAMARLGAAEVHGIDLGAAGLEDARSRARTLPQVHFKRASVLDIPFPDASFDMVWCAGVVMITADPERALDELTRVLVPGGRLFLLVYADGGMRWPLIATLRPIAAQLGREAIERAMRFAKLPANKRRTFLDDLFCPRLDFFNWDRLRRMLDARNYRAVDRWSPVARLDHEHGLAQYREDIESLRQIFEVGHLRAGDQTGALFERGFELTDTVVRTIRWFEDAIAAGRTDEGAAMDLVIGQGHHRVVAQKPMPLSD